jgi:multiple sugar transport system substrate-binding protein
MQHNVGHMMVCYWPLWDVEMSETQKTSRARRMVAFACTLMALLALVWCGCDKSNPAPATTQAPTTAPPSDVRLMIVDHPELAGAISRLQGEWKAQTDSRLEIKNITADALKLVDRLDADAVIYSPAMLGALVERKLIRPMNPAWLKDDALDAGDLIEPLKSPELCWDGEQYAVPFGSPVFVLLYRPDLFERFGKQPPRTWEEYQSLATFFSDRKKLRPTAKTSDSKTDPLQIPDEWYGTLEPLASPWGARTLLARATAYAKHRDYYSVLFDRETMEPLIAGPAFVRALTELAAATKEWPAGATNLGLKETLELFFSGHSAMAIGWPVVDWDAPGNTTEAITNVSVAIAALPGSAVAYNPGHAAWEERRGDDPASIPLRGAAGLVGSVTRGANSPEAAFKLLTWLGSKHWSSEAFPKVRQTTMFRQSQFDDIRTWLGPPVPPPAGAEYDQVLSAAMRQPEAVWALRIPGEAEYMTALDDAVQAAVRGTQTPQQALDNAAQAWTKITEQLGKEQQLEAYRRSLKSAP